MDKLVMIKNSSRIISLDAFRGLTIVLMIIVNSQSTMSYPILEHADWNGCTLADLVFPSFLFIVGLTLVISLKKNAQIENKPQLYQSIFKRSMILFLLGVLLNLFPYFNFSTVRVCGVLQRIALCYFCVALIYLNTSWRTQCLIFVTILLGYWLFLTQVPVPGQVGGSLEPTSSWNAYIDQCVISLSRLRNKPYDPEGLLSTIPALATTLMGVLVGQWLMSKQSKKNHLMGMLLGAFILLVSGWLWAYSFPINKNLWTSTYVLWAGGLSILVFALCFLCIDILDYKKCAAWLIIFGMNALFAFILHVLLLKIQVAWKIDETLSIKDFITHYLFGCFSPANAVLLYSLCFLSVNFLIVWILYHRKIFIRL